MHPSDLKPLQLLNNQIGIHNNRLECYNFAARETDVLVLKALFSQLIETSYLCQEELAREVYKLGGIPEKNTLPYIEFFKAWVDIKSALKRKDHAAILNSCAYEEGLVLRSYEKTLLAGHEETTTQQQNIFHKQYNILRTDHDKVNNLRNVLLKAA